MDVGIVKLILEWKEELGSFATAILLAPFVWKYYIKPFRDVRKEKKEAEKEGNKEDKEEEVKEIKQTEAQVVTVGFLQKWMDVTDATFKDMLKLFEEKTHAVNLLSIKQGFEDIEEEAFPGLRKEIVRLSDGQEKLTKETKQVHIELRNQKSFLQNIDNRVAINEKNIEEATIIALNAKRRVKEIEKCIMIPTETKLGKQA